MRIDYRLSGTGWADATVSDGEASAELSASYLADALGDLLRAVVALTEGAAEARCSWAEEPGEYRWIFARRGDDVSLRILGFLRGQRSDAEGEEQFATTRPLRTFVTAAVAAASAVLDPARCRGVRGPVGGAPVPGRATRRVTCLARRLTVEAGPGRR